MLLVIFDIDGTLTDTTGIDDYCFFKTFYDLFTIDVIGADWSNYKNVTDLGITTEVFLEKLNRLPTNEEIGMVKDYFLRLLKTSWELTPERFMEIPGAKSILIELIKRGFKLGFATGAWKDAAMIKLNSINIDPTLFPFGNSDHSPVRKEIIEETIKQARKIYSSDFERIVYIGDGLWDYETCKEMQIDFIGIDSKKNGLLESLGADKTLQDFSDKKAFINLLV